MIFRTDYLEISIPEIREENVVFVLECNRGNYKVLDNFMSSVRDRDLALTQLRKLSGNGDVLYYSKFVRLLQPKDTYGWTDEVTLWYCGEDMLGREGFYGKYFISRLSHTIMIIEKRDSYYHVFRVQVSERRPRNFELGYEQVSLGDAQEKGHGGVVLSESCFHSLPVSSKKLSELFLRSDLEINYTVSISAVS